jgi:hypothetical protein
MYNLNNLTIETKNIRMDRHMWEILIQKYLLNLEICNLKMKFELNDCDDLEQEINEITNTYRTDFWIKQHQWFIRCLSYKKNQSNIVYLHTS